MRPVSRPTSSRSTGPSGKRKARPKGRAAAARPAPPRSRLAWPGAALALLGLLYLALDSDRGLSTWLRLRQELGLAEARIASLERGNAELRAEAEALQSDDFAQERAIRELLGWARPGEVVVRVPEPRPDALPLP